MKMPDCASFGYGVFIKVYLKIYYSQDIEEFTVLKGGE